jgi:spore coat polysaccharide biosynthesis protein SpsF (cytidylyltransferase family)
VPAAAGRRRFPDGLDAECFTRDALEAAWREATAAYDREHVTPYLKDRPERFGVAYLQAEEDLGEERWTLDTRADLTFLEALSDALAGGDPAFGYRDVVGLLGSRPDLQALRPMI